jgi:hypothetical protein
MGKQYNKVIKSRRRADYLNRKKEAAAAKLKPKARTAKPVKKTEAPAAPAAAAPATPAV